MAFHREQRIKRGADFDRAMRHGIRFSDGAFTVYVVHAGNTHARLGIAVGRRVSVKAVVRNRIKRIIRENFRREAQLLPAVDIVFNARTQAAEKNRASLSANISRVLLKLKSMELHAPKLPPSTV